MRGLPQLIDAPEQVELAAEMAGCVHWAADFGIITAAYRRELFRMFSARGWRRKEPGARVSTATHVAVQVAGLLCV